ncbi:helix-turn-helix transcriptional regulator [Shouchella clausii]|uniref:helix-turn-helix domain-containing protein n=1 Tax=Shouchella clausii TaxID=79880 RepID=UPI0026F41B43|nr:helix-turn-helix transcriptional regulator [Shouchella clausii]MDO7285879.1 helix-turn-helix transcriptional regulator [Shouchella clausii]MDO7305782.1 helix-turn-helix transcriptional regulator [Shouchella clausii]
MFAKRLKQLRRNKKITQEDMSNMLGISRQGYGKYENGKTEPDHDTLVKIANYFEVSTDYLLGRTDTPNSESSIYEDEDEREFIMQQLDQYRKIKKRIQERLEGER